MEMQERDRGPAPVRMMLRALDELPLSVAVLDARGVIVAVNRRWLDFASENAGDPLKTGCGSNYLDVCGSPGPNSTGLKAHLGLTRVLEGRADAFELEYPCHSPDQQRWFLMRAAPLRGENGQVTGAVVTHLNITARRLAETELDHRARDLERSNKDLSQFAHIVAHDLKEPLRGMEHFAQFVLEDEPGLSHDSRSKLGTIMRLAQRTTATIEGLLQLARVGTGDLKRAPVDLHEVAEEILDSFRPQLESAGARASIQSRLPVLECDRVLVAQAIANLVSNAIKYNDKATKTIEIGPATENKGFYIRDNGIGIPVHQQQQLFRAFTRLQPHGAFGGGAGIGLSIVQRIAERHDGSVHVESAPGEGSTFTVLLVPHPANDA